MTTHAVKRRRGTSYIGRMNPARAERQRFADTLAQAGPDAPTLCDPWTTRDLAAHIVIRERRPDAAVGILAKPAAGHTDKVQRKRAAGTPWDALVELVRSGPPVWSPTRLDAIDVRANAVEFFVHHEDVLRAAEGWSPRELDPELVEAIWVKGSSAKLLVRKSPVGIVLEPTDGHDAVVAKKGPDTVTVKGPVGELVLWSFGRQAQALVHYEGPEAAVESVRDAEFGV